MIMNKKSSLLLIGLVLGVTAQIRAMDKTPITAVPVTFEKQGAKPQSLSLHFIEPNSNNQIAIIFKDQKIVISNNNELYVKTLTFGDLVSKNKELIVLSESPGRQEIKEWTKPIVNWIRDHYGEAKSMIMIIVYGISFGRIWCEFFDSQDKSIGMVKLGEFK